MKVSCDNCGIENEIDDAALAVAVGPVACTTCGAALVLDLPRSTAPADASAEAVWYVTVDAAQQGPMTLAQVRERLQRGDFAPDALVWRAGMAQWEPISALAEWVAQPQEEAGGSGQASATAPATARASADPSQGQQQWQAPTAQALAQLAQNEFGAASRGERQARSTPAAGGFVASQPAIKEAPGFGVEDFLGGRRSGADGGSESRERADRGVGRAARFGGGTIWALPVGRRADGGLKPLYIVLVALGGVAAVALLVVVAVRLLMPTVVPVPMASSVPVSAPAGVPAPAPAALAPAPTPAPAAAVAATPVVAEAPEGAGAAPAEETETQAAAKRRRAEAAKQERRAANSERPAAAPPPRPAPPAAAAAVQTSLTKSDIVDGIKKNASLVAPCLQQARAANEITPGQYTFVLDWTIAPDGGVTNARLSGPANVLSTSLPRCFAQAMGRWRFPASRDGAPIRNFPFGPINVR